MDIKKLDSIAIKPIYIQMAKNGVWDNTWKISIPNDKPTKFQVIDYLKDNPERVAFELFYETVDNYKFLFGSYFSESFIVKNKVDFLNGIFDIVFSETNIKVSEVISKVSSLCTGSNETYFQGNPSEVLLGVLDSWRFYNPCTLWKGNNEVIPNEIDIEKMLSSYPMLVNNKDNTSLLEFVWPYSILHFVGFTVSDFDKTNTTYKLNYKYTTKIIEALL